MPTLDRIYSFKFHSGYSLGNGLKRTKVEAGSKEPVKRQVHWAKREMTVVGHRVGHTSLIYSIKIQKK